MNPDQEALSKIEAHLRLAGFCITAPMRETFAEILAALPSAEEGKEAKAGAPIAPWAMALKIRGNGITAERAGEMLDEWRKASLAMTLPDDPRFPMLCSDGSYPQRC